MYEYLIHFAQRFSTFLMNFQFEERLLSCQTNQATQTQPNQPQAQPQPELELERNAMESKGNESFGLELFKYS